MIDLFLKQFQKYNKLEYSNNENNRDSPDFSVMGTGSNPCAEWWAIETGPSQYCSLNATTNYRSIFSVSKKPYTAESGTVSGSRTGVSSKSECE